MFITFRCTALDIVTSYCLNKTLGAIDFPDFQHPVITSLQYALPFIWVLRYPPWLTSMATNPPDGIMENPDILLKADHPTIYQHLLTVSKERKTRRDLTKVEMYQEALDLMTAGSDTVGNAATDGFFHVLCNQNILKKLKTELTTAWPDLEVNVGYATLGKFPYLTAVIKESLRLAHGVVSSIPRVVGPKDAVIAGISVPKGTNRINERDLSSLKRGSLSKCGHFYPGTLAGTFC